MRREGGDVIAMAVRQEHELGREGLDVYSGVQDDTELRKEVGRGVGGPAKADNGQALPQFDAAEGVIVSGDANVPPLRPIRRLRDGRALSRGEDLEGTSQGTEGPGKGFHAGGIPDRLEHAGQLRERNPSVAVDVS